MNLALSPVHQKTLAEQFRPALLCVVLVFVGVLVIPAHYPVTVSEGEILPSVLRPTDKATVHWKQTWRELCPVTVIREFVGADAFKKTSAPFDLIPPLETGVSPYDGPITIPDLPVGDASYHSIIQPHCWIDRFWARSYHTPEIKITMLPPLPAGGPR